MCTDAREGGKAGRVKTIFNTDFAYDEEIVLYRGAEIAWSGKVADMTDELKREFGLEAGFAIDPKSEEYEYLFA